MYEDPACPERLILTSWMSRTTRRPGTIGVRLRPRFRSRRRPATCGVPHAHSHPRHRHTRRAARPVAAVMMTADTEALALSLPIETGLGGAVAPSPWVVTNQAGGVTGTAQASATGQTFTTAHEPLERRPDHDDHAASRVLNDKREVERRGDDHDAVVHGGRTDGAAASASGQPNWAAAVSRPSSLCRTRAPPAPRSPRTPSSSRCPAGGRPRRR